MSAAIYPIIKRNGGMGSVNKPVTAAQVLQAYQKHVETAALKTLEFWYTGDIPLTTISRMCAEFARIRAKHNLPCTPEWNLHPWWGDLHFSIATLLKNPATYTLHPIHCLTIDWPVPK